MDHRIDKGSRQGGRARAPLEQSVNVPHRSARIAFLPSTVHSLHTSCQRQADPKGAVVVDVVVFAPGKLVVLLGT
jgi:hypothetical protein